MTCSGIRLLKRNFQLFVKNYTSLKRIFFNEFVGKDLLSFSFFNSSFRLGLILKSMFHHKPNLISPVSKKFPF